MSRDPLDHLVPADDAIDPPLKHALAVDAAARLSRALRAWRRLAPPAPVRAAFAGCDPADGAFRTWLADVEDSLAVGALAARVAARPARRRRTSAAWGRLIDAIADAGVLAALAPRGRIPDTFAPSALAHVRSRLTASAGAVAALARRGPRLPGDPEIGRVLVERGTGIVEGSRDRGFERRVLRALAILDRAWPEGAAMIRRRTWRVVPVTAWATVSYSSARQPGIVYIDVASAPLVRLAEDLIHETTHARVHELEALRPLVTTRAAETSDGTEPRFYSPWRREWRPLRGLVHATCTFTVGARFFERMLVAPMNFSGARRRWLARRLLEERASVAASLRVLRGAAARRLLTPAGRRVVQAAEREHRALARAAAGRRGELAATAAGRSELKRLLRFEAALSRQPVRWSGER